MGIDNSYLVDYVEYLNKISIKREDVELSRQVGKLNKLVKSEKDSDELLTKIVTRMMILDSIMGKYNDTTYINKSNRLKGKILTIF